MLSTIDWKKFMAAQGQLEDGNPSDENRTPERFLALMVELNEFANATKVFKYWSIRGSDREHTLDEFADVFGFILTNLLEKGMDPTGISYPKPTTPKSNRELTLQFLALVSDYRYPMDNEDFRKWIGDFFSLGSSYGFSFEDLENAYWKKWKVNLQRQSSGYY